MRLIDADPIVETLKEARKKADSPRRDLDLLILQEMIQLAPTITPPPNDLLTLEELREMDGEPVWVDDIVFRRDRSCGGLWGIVVLACDEIIFGDRDSMPLKDVVGFAYRRKPEAATHE